ncbi:hypothetical protein VB780_06525 [Leptolyngbya sp. CCNP1308]|nr:hypothetical protein [Leptolyngbya sp. CCNP1308]MEA5448217.1 hypothetical protein [Leptolyngbya sp. CCNP1308]
MKRQPFFLAKQSQVNILRGEPPLRHTAPLVPLLPRQPNNPLAELSGEI